MCRDLLYPEKEQVTLSKNKGNNTNYCVAERGNLRKLALTGYEPRSYLLGGTVLGQNLPYALMESFAHEISAPIDAMLPQLA